MSYELRSIVGPESIDATDEGVIFGLAIPYNKVTTIGDMAHGGFREQIAPGSCTKSMREADIVALFNHDSSKPLGRTSAGNLKLTNTVRGVEPELNPVPTTYAADLKELVNSKTIRGWSFGFEVVKDEWTDPEGKPSNEFMGTDRTIREMKLIEVSPVTFPAYGDGMTNIASRDAVTAARESRGRTWEGRSIDKAMMYMGDATSFLIDAFNELTEEQLALMPETIRTAITNLAMRDGDPKKPYGDVTYADPGYQADKKKRYPIDTAAHAKAAWSYINKAGNASAYSSTQLAAIKGRIKAACTKFGITISDQNAADLVKEWRIYRKGYKIAESRAVVVAGQCPMCGKVVGGEDNNASTADDDSTEGDNDNKFGQGHNESGDNNGDAAYGQQTDNQGNPISDKFNKDKVPSTPPAKSGIPVNQNSAKQKSEKRNKKAKRDVPKGMSSGTAKRIPQIDALLAQALKLFGAADIDSLPADVQSAIALISSASTHASHIVNHEGMAPADSISDNDKDGRSTRDAASGIADQGIDTDDINDNNADDFATCVDCGYINPMDAESCERCGGLMGNPTGRSAKTPANKRVSNLKPGTPTSKTPLTNQALDDKMRFEFALAASREIDLGI